VLFIGKFLYKQLYDDMRQGILDGKYPPGSKLPTESNLRDDFAVSDITVKKALSLLADQGMVRRVPGKGTFVIDQAANSKPAGSVRKDGTKLIGVVLEHVATPFGLDMMYRMDQQAEKLGYKLLIRFSYADREAETREINFLISQKAEGLIIMPSHGTHYNTSILKLIVNKFPVILIDKKLEGIPVPSVRTDNCAAAGRLVRCLVESGCRNISLITSNEDNATSLEERKRGFYNEISTLGLPVYRECIVPSKTEMVSNEPHISSVEAITRFLNEEKKMLDGIVCAEYGISLAFMKAAKAADVVPGRDLKVCCFDEDYLSPHGYYFTHVKQDEVTIADKAVSLLITQIQGGEIKEEDHRIPAIFMKGQTT
jgi:DNA-binding LacI/PurR family transcriptional regulator